MSAEDFASDTAPGAEDSTPFTEDCIVTGAARLAGMEVYRSVSIVVTDRKALDEQGLMRRSPDYNRIRQLLSDGAIVQGAHFGPVEYTLRKRGGENECR